MCASRHTQTLSTPEHTHCHTCPVYTVGAGAETTTAELPVLTKMYEHVNRCRERRIPSSASHRADSSHLLPCPPQPRSRKGLPLHRVLLGLVHNPLDEVTLRSCNQSAEALSSLLIDIRLVVESPSALTNQDWKWSSLSCS